MLPSAGALLALLFLGLALLSVGPAPARALHNVTAELFGAEAWGTLAAFGDLNSDKQTDLFVLRESQCLPAPPLFAPPCVFTPPCSCYPSSCISQPCGSPFISSFTAFPGFNQPRFLTRSPHDLIISSQPLGTHQPPFTHKLVAFTYLQKFFMIRKNLCFWPLLLLSLLKRPVFHLLWSEEMQLDIFFL